MTTSPRLYLASKGSLDSLTNADMGSRVPTQFLHKYEMQDSAELFSVQPHVI